MHSSANVPTRARPARRVCTLPAQTFLSELMFMSRLARSCRALVVGLAAAAAMLSTTQVASAAAPEPTVDPAIAVPAGNKVFLVGHATGVQIYTCNNGAWGTASTPRATLVDDKGKVVATHFAGPTWQATDGR